MISKARWKKPTKTKYRKSKYKTQTETKPTDNPSYMQEVQMWLETNEESVRNLGNDP